MKRIGFTDRKVFYASGVDMRLSFHGLTEIAEKKLGAKLNEADLVVFDSANQTKRKVLVKTSKGFAILYMSRIKKDDLFIPFAKSSGLTKERAVYLDQ